MHLNLVRAAQLAAEADARRWRVEVSVLPELLG
jgi:hypothetical protein